MTETPLDKSKYGTLLWPGFYGPSIEYNKSFYNKYVNNTLMILATALFLATGLLLFLGGGDVRMGMLNLAIAIGIPVFWWAINRNSPTAMDYQSMLRRGALDWDLYENGFLTRAYSNDEPGHVHSVFFGFDRFSKAFVHIDEANAIGIWELVKAAAKKDRKEDGGEDVESDFAWGSGARTLVRGHIWFVDKESGTIDFQLDQNELADPARLETVLRQKLKAVE
jgi:hypothetical protein